MKKILFGILTFLGIGLSFCSAGSYSYPGESFTYVDNYSYTVISFYGVPSIVKGGGPNGPISCNFENLSYTGPGTLSVMTFYYDYGIQSASTSYFGSAPGIVGCGLYTSDAGTYDISFDSLTISGNTIVESSSSSSEDITVFYNNGNSSESITCDGTQAIEIQGLSTITSTNTFTPFFNISYKDENNQSLIESYSKDILYLSGGLFKKTYTGDNEWILSSQGSSENTFTGYVPVFDFTGDTIVNTGNVFNNFSDNALRVLLSNIPSYIQYITIFMILVFLFSFIRRFKRKS